MKYKKGKQFDSAEELVKHLAQGLPYYWEPDDEVILVGDSAKTYYDIEQFHLPDYYHAEEIKEREFIEMFDYYSSQHREFKILTKDREDHLGGAYVHHYKKVVNGRKYKLFLDDGSLEVTE